MHASPQRRRPSLATVVSFAALFVALSDSGAAATFSQMFLGKTNRTTRTTGIAAPTKGPVLALANTAAGVAGSFNVKPGTAPFAVNSQTLVKNLNADVLDGTSSAGFWNTNGNAGTTPAKNYVGTSDNQPLSVRTDGNEAVRIDTSGNVGIGTSAPSSPLTVVGANAATGDVVLAGTNAGTALHGQANTGTGLFASSDSGTAISADTSTGTALKARSATGPGIIGTSTTVGVAGSNTPSECPGGLFLPGNVGVAGCGGGLGVFGEGDKWGVLGSLEGPSSGSCATGAAAVVACGAQSDGVFADVGNFPKTGAAAFHASVENGGTILLGDFAGHTKVRIDSNGKGYFDGGTAVTGADYADSMRADGTTRLRPGDVLAIDPAKPNTVGLSRTANSTLVAGVYSTKPSVLGIGSHHIGDSLAGSVPVALVGVVPTRVSTENGPVFTGDLLTSAGTPGYAMKAKPVMVNGVPTYPPGTIIGKAMQPLAGGKRLINVLVTLR